MTFLTRYDKKPFKPSVVGKREYCEARVVYSPDGNLTLEYGKTRDRQTEINSYAASCDVNMLVKRYENGDATAILRSNTGVYADLSSMPKTIHEAQKLARSVNDLYDSMDDALKVKYSTFEDFRDAFANKDNFSQFVNFAKDVYSKRHHSSNSNTEVVDNA